LALTFIFIHLQARFASIKPPALKPSYGLHRTFRVNEAIMRADFKRLNFKFMSLDALLAANNLRFSKFALRFAVDYAYIFAPYFAFTQA